MSITQSVNTISGVPLVLSPHCGDLLKCSCNYCLQFESLDVNIDSSFSQGQPMEELLAAGSELLHSCLTPTYAFNVKAPNMGGYHCDTFLSENANVPIQDQHLALAQNNITPPCCSLSILQDDFMPTQTDVNKASSVPDENNLLFQTFLKQFLEEDPCLFNLVDNPASQGSWPIENISQEVYPGTYQPQPFFVTQQQQYTDSPEPFTPGLSTCLSQYDSPMLTDRSTIMSMNGSPNTMFMPFYELKSNFDYASNTGEENTDWLHRLLRDPVTNTSSGTKNQRNKRGRKGVKSSDKIKKHICCFCSYSTDRVSNFIRHVESHTRCVNEWECKPCAISFSSKSNLARHNRRTRH
ncbi:C2H2-type zinc finger transcription factor [Phycomyces blakesleeanus]|uniref:C2H2-type zinc finger transcription factor n=2 Tax=Phycomyces blakesleeanus TaxID=4837 RepID=A0A167K1L3_PHYB8|nr:C2H2-type zinc finger transcription factor [Phycomyces blakesleeanus NRRL 1555(-)]OAD67076.1 C2H2-type zinc finger transcription factor [Phycomyces blakesleeanus NRRL 1555(-)]|eukprot:XP_018285116.1 C2H2-type zinc finger transcription factor [Phycomyces blakesleeanus NRRL 1555(-)]